MATSNLDYLINSLPKSDINHLKLHNIQDDHQCNSSSSLITTTPINALHNDTQQNEKEDTNPFACGLKIQIPSPAGEFKVNNGDNDPKTPTTTEHKIPVMMTCPLAPRKAKWIPATTGKRKTPFFPGVIIAPEDFLIYVDEMLALNEAVYVPDYVVGDLAAGECAKRLKRFTPTAHEP